MENPANLLQTADFKIEKHIPIIECSDSMKQGESLRITVTVGSEIPHPNKTEHHIRWIDVYFHADGEKFPLGLGKTEFLAHGESPQGPDTSTIYSRPTMSISFRSEKPGTLHAMSCCNIHGLWQSSKHLAITRAEDAHNQGRTDL